jgi:phage tail sheath protein FI
MPEYLAPGVYVEEVSTGIHTIEGVSTSTAAFLGVTERGPLRPALVTGFNDYVRRFGIAQAVGEFMPDAVRGFFANGGTHLYVCRVVSRGAIAASHDFGALRVTAAGPGTWGNHLFVEVLPSTLPNPDNPESRIHAGFRLRIAYRNCEAAAPVLPDDASSLDHLPADTIEDFHNLSVDDRSPHYFARVNELSALVTLSLHPERTDRIVIPTGHGAALQGGSDGFANDLDFTGDHAEPDRQSGLTALKQDAFRDVALVCAPGLTAPRDKAVLEQIIAHCEQLRYRFAVIDGPAGEPQPTALDPQTQIAASRYAAFYYPWLVVRHPDTGARQVVPPGGHILGALAHGGAVGAVYRTPAVHEVCGAVDVEFHIDDQTSAAARTRGVNVIEPPRDGVMRVGGARTLAAEAEWKYVHMRRLFIYLERSIDEGTRWAVFQPNGEALWARVRQTIENFLHREWRRGLLIGQKPEQAFFVKCDRTTMTQNDIDNGRLICEVGVAPIKPAEFVIFRIGQWTADGPRDD